MKNMKNEKSSEEQGKMEVEKNLNQTIAYISDKEAELSNYSDKMRKSVVRIFNIFGDPEYCQICGSSKSAGLGARCAGHEFVPKIRLSLNYSGVPFSHYTDNDQYKQYRKLASRDGELCIEEYCEEDEEQGEVKKSVEDLSRKTLKYMIKQKAITEFLSGYIDLLDYQNNEYKEVSEIAERIANSL